MIADKIDTILQYKNEAFNCPENKQPISLDAYERISSLTLMYIPANARDGFKIKEIVDEPDWLKDKTKETEKILPIRELIGNSVRMLIPANGRDGFQIKDATDKLKSLKENIIE